jgi:hypothetical protein
LDNTSGQGARAVVPPEIRRWNWGAFLLNWIWGCFGNETFISLLCFVPLVNLVMPFVLGAKGNEWAWRNARWNDVAHFRRVQRKWAIAGLVVHAAVIAVIAGSIALFVYQIGHSEAYLTAVAEIKANPTAISELGTPITGGFPVIHLETHDDTGSAQLSFHATGPKANSTVFAVETLRAGHWVITHMELEIVGREGHIKLIGR